MFSLTKNNEEPPRPLEEALRTAVSDLGMHSSHSKEYSTIAANIKVLAEANATDQVTYKKLSVSPETKASIAANLLGILIILNHERAHVLTSKAMQQLAKIRI